jgi:hypothetical protein
MSNTDKTTAAVTYAVVGETNRKTYRVGNDGSAWSRSGDKEWRQLKPSPQPSGHTRIWLGRGNTNMRFIHNLVLEAFVGPRPEGLLGCHKDDNPANNNIKNLYWGTAKQNTADAIRNGNTRDGENSSSAKLTEATVLQVVELKTAGMPMWEIAEKVGCSRANIEAIVYGRSWNRVTGIPAPVKVPGAKGRPVNPNKVIKIPGKRGRPKKTTSDIV